MSFELSGSNNTVIGHGARPPSAGASNTVSVGSGLSRVYLAGATDAQGVSCTNTALYFTGASLNVGGSTGTTGQAVISNGAGGIQWGSVPPPAQSSVAVPDAGLSPAAPLAQLYVCNSTGFVQVQLTLPAPSTCAGSIVQVKNFAQNAPFKVTSAAQVVPSGGISASDPDPLGAGGNCTLASDATNWYMMSLVAGTPINNAPGAPGSVAITVTPGVTPTTSSMTATWTAATAGVTPLDYYTVRIYQGELAPSNLVTSGTVAASALTKMLTGTFNLTSVAQFYATVTATNSAPASLTGPAGQSTGYSWAVVPAAPSSIAIAVPASATPAALSVSWTAPPVAVLPLASYNVSIYQSDSTLIGQSLGVSPGAISYNVPPVSSYNLATVLQPITAQVTAINSYGASPVGDSPSYNWYTPTFGGTPLTANGKFSSNMLCSSITAAWNNPQVYNPGDTIQINLSTPQPSIISITSDPIVIGTTNVYQFNPVPPATGFALAVGGFYSPITPVIWTVTVTVSTGASAQVPNISLY